MEEEIEYRKLVVRKEAIEAVKEARAQGDLSENFEYYAAKRDKNKNESRIRYLERMIRTAHVISDTSKEDEVGIYNTVDVYFEEDDETETYKIVTTVRGNSLKGLISSESPLGKALLGHKSLLPSGITEVKGVFLAGEVVAVMDSAGSVFAKAVPYFDSTEREKLQGHKSSEIGSLIGEGRKDVIFRPEDLVFTDCVKL